MIKKALVVCLTLWAISWIALACAVTPKTSEIDKAIYKWSRQYDLDPLLVKAIICVESRSGKDLLRNDSYRLHQQKWAIDAVREYKCDVRDPMIWYSLGHMQVLYLTALHGGYQGDPRGLLNINTNLKYGCQYLADKQIFYSISDKGKWHAVASYNAGKARTINGKYINHEYVDMVRAVYFKLGGRDGL